MAKLTLPHWKIISYVPFVLVCNFLGFQYKEHKVCLTKIPTHGIFKLLLVIYFQNMCIVTCDFQWKKKCALLCFLHGFGIAVPAFSY